MFSQAISITEQWVSLIFCISSFLPFQMAEILCSLILNYTSFGEWTKTLSHWGLIWLKRFESVTQFIKFYQSGRVLWNMWLLLKCSPVGTGLNGSETNWIRHPADEQLRHVDIFFSNHYNLQSVHFELYEKIDEIIFIQVSRCYHCSK